MPTAHRTPASIPACPVRTGSPPNTPSSPSTTTGRPPVVGTGRTSGLSSRRSRRRTGSRARRRSRPRRTLHAVSGVILQVREGETLRHRRGVRLRQDHGRADAGRAGARRPAGAVRFDGGDISRLSAIGDGARRRGGPADDVPGLLGRAGPADDGRRPHREPLAAQRVGDPRANAGSTVRELLDAVGSATDGRPALPARVLRRPAAADRDGPRARAAARRSSWPTSRSRRSTSPSRRRS